MDRSFEQDMLLFKTVDRIHKGEDPDVKPPVGKAATLLIELLDQLKKMLKEVCPSWLVNSWIPLTFV
jgi:hypothetical protein